MYFFKTLTAAPAVFFVDFRTISEGDHESLGHFRLILYKGTFRRDANPPSLLQLHLFLVHLFAAVACLMRAKFSRPTALTLVKKGRDGKYTGGYSNNRSG